MWCEDMGVGCVRMWGDVGVGMCVKRFISMIHNRTVGGKRKWFCEGRGGGRRG